MKLNKYIDRLYIVTIKVKHGLDHNPRNKITGRCPQLWGAECSDVTGEHHSFIFLADSVVDAKTKLNHLNITRIESARFMNGDSFSDMFIRGYDKSITPP